MKKIINKHPYILLSILLVLSVLFSISFGAVSIDFGKILAIVYENIFNSALSIEMPDYFRTIVLDVRIPHTALIVLTGAALATSGAAYQGLFRNPLADPYMIGIASGAGLGAVFGMALRNPENPFGMFFIPMSAFFGAIITVVVVYQLAKVGKTVPLTTLILAGVAVSSFTSALTSLLMLRSDGQIYRAIAFLMGGNPVSGWDPILAVLPYMVLGIGSLMFSGHLLNVLQFGEDQAKHLGVNVEKAKIFIIVTASLTAAAAVAFSGIIGFIGLVVPHIVRMIWGPDYRKILPYSIFGGSIALVLADLIARILLAPSVLPVGIVTALAGTPFFLWILRKAKREVFW